MERSYYSTLQVNRKASAEEIERSYQRLAKIYDPERSRKRRARERWAQIQEAYEVLSDPERRAEYDREIKPRYIPGLGHETPLTRFLTSRWGLPSLAGIIGAIVLAAVLVGIFAGGDEGGEAVLGSPTPTEPATSTPITTPPPVEGEEMVTDSGLTVITIEEGTGESPEMGDTVRVHYTGWLASDETKFDSSLDRGEPTLFVVGQVIEGWNEGLQLMKEGGKTRLLIPANLAYGEGGSPPRIPPNADLIFDIELIEVRKPGETPAATGDASPSPAATPTPTPEDGS